MKKVLLTTALLFTFAFTYANEPEKKSDATAEPKEVKEVKKTEPQTKTIKPVVMPECYHLSCKVVCFDNAVLGGGDCDIECIFDMLEIVCCQM